MITCSHSCEMTQREIDSSILQEGLELQSTKERGQRPLRNIKEEIF